jgi:hypothetical protein
MSTEPKPPSFIPLSIARVLAVIATVATAATPFVPEVARQYVALSAFVLAFLAGIAMPQLKVTAGNPVATGAVGTTLASLAVGAEQLASGLPTAYQPVVYAVAALLAILAGKSLPSFATAQVAGAEAAKAPGPNLGA